MSDEQEQKKDLNIIKLEPGETVNISKALGSSKRLAILKHISKNELNLSEIAAKIDSTPQAVYHHLQILEKSKLVRVVREANIKNMAKTIKYYRSNFHPEAINLLLWAPLEQVEIAELQERVPIAARPVERIARKISNSLFKDKTDFKVELLTNYLKDLVDLTHESMISLKDEYGLAIDEKLWNLLLLFSGLSVMNSFKKVIEKPKLRVHFDDLIHILYDELIDFSADDNKDIDEDVE